MLQSNITMNLDKSKLLRNHIICSQQNSNNVYYSLSTVIAWPQYLIDTAYVDTGYNGRVKEALLEQV